MSKRTRVSLAQLKKKAGPEVERLLREVNEAIHQAPDGAVIAGSEEAVRDAMARFRERVYERGLQLRADAAASAFPPAGPDERPAGAEQGPAGREPRDGQRGG
jgi:hypothetical protein